MDKQIRLQDASVDNASDIGFIQSQTWLDSYVNENLGITRTDIRSKIEEWNKGGEERIAAELLKPNSHTWVAKDGDRIVGFAAGVKKDFENSIEALHVLPEYQKQGIGTELLKKVLDWLGDEKKIIMEVVVYNVRAQELYKKFDFKIVGPALDDPIILPSGKTIPKLLMSKG